ncbi:MAG TPA: hypothetical protein VIF09_02555, partial [Polyangiaceae bacterium]
MRELLPFVLLACACGAAVREPPLAPLPSAAAATATAPEPSAATPDDPAAFEALRSLGPTVAPGMREVIRRESADAVELVKADARDACLRAAFEAPTAVTAKLLDETGRVLAESTTASAHGVLGEKGPVCVRKGEVVTGIAAPGGTR